MLPSAPWAGPHGAGLTKQVRVCTGTDKYDLSLCGIPEQEPVRFDVALPVPSILAGEPVCVVAGRQGVFTRKHRHDPIQLCNFLAPLFHELPVAFELRSRGGAEQESLACVELRDQLLHPRSTSQVTPRFGVTYRPTSRPIRQFDQEWQAAVFNDLAVEEVDCGRR